MASPRYLFGSGASDFAIAPPSRHGGFVVSAANLGNGTLWSASSGGIQYTDLQTVNGGAIATISTDADGGLVAFYGPPGVDGAWLDFGGGSRAFLPASRGQDTHIAGLISDDASAAAVALDARTAAKVQVQGDARYTQKTGLSADVAALAADPASAAGLAVDSRGDARWTQKSGLSADVATHVANPTSAAGAAVDTRGDGRWTKKTLSPLMMLDYCVGDATADDTVGAQAAFDAAVAQGRPLFSPAGKEYLVDPLTAATGLVLQGDFTFRAKTNNQSAIISITGKQDWSRASVTINGFNRALYGIRASNSGRSRLGHLNVNRCLVWGYQSDKVGNNNLVQFDRFTATLCGRSSTQVLTETAETANVLTSTAGYGSFTLATPLTADQVATDVTYYVIVSGLAYKVKAITTTTIDVFNLKAAAGVGDVVTAKIVTGGALNWVSWGDNGVGTFAAVDISSCQGAAIHQASLYGHTYNDAVLQANSIGFCCSTYSQGTSFHKPYFEANDVDYVSWDYVEGIMFAPLLTTNRIQNCVNRVGGNGNTDPRLIVLKNQTYGLVGNVVAGLNPGSRTLTPGQTYGFHYSATLGETFVIDNSDLYGAFGAFSAIMVDLSHANSGTTGSLSISLSTNNGQTIEGIAFGTPYTNRVTDKTMLKIFRVGTDWKVQIFRGNVPHTSIAAAPVFVGQLAVVGAVAYVAVGTSASTDWKQIT